jgi:starch synthase
MNKIWLVAAENDALPNGKVGGVGDVVRDLPLALVELGLDVSVITPSYGMFHKLPGAEFYRKIRLGFARRSWVAYVYKVPVADSPVKHFVIEHALLSPNGPGQIYVSDAPGNPFAIDSAKFAFFNAAIAAWINNSDQPPGVLHLHDWHMGLIPALKKFGKAEAALSKVHIVFTIHNLAYQGVRPLRDHPSSLQAWFPGLVQHENILKDPTYLDCVNFMASAIRLADAINTVSPSYAMEIQRPSDPSTGFSGGEGLEVELSMAYSEGRLTGIINGCMYPENAAPVPRWHDLLQLIAKRPDIINAGQPAEQWLQSWRDKRPVNLLLSIGRVVDQKVPLFLEPVEGYATALEAILTSLGPESLFIMLGSGEKEFEDRFADIAQSSENFLYLRGYVDALSAPLYSICDLFLMPSSFEPCGISQMLSMREGQPCVVHAVGGLKDTVTDGVTGFVFDGKSISEQAGNFVRCVVDAISLKQEHPAQWKKICSNAAVQRFSWPAAATRYMETLYQYD